MDKLASFNRYYLSNSPLHQNPISHSHKPKSGTQSLTSISLAVTASTSLDTIPPLSTSPSSSPSLSDLKTFHFEGGLTDNDVRTLDRVKAMHALMIKACNKQKNSDSRAEVLITSYLEADDYRSASTLFFLGFGQNFGLWSSFSKEFEKYAVSPRQVLEVFRELNCKGVIFDCRAVTAALRICASAMDLWLGLQVHADLIKRGFELDLYVKCALMNFYGGCCDLKSANQVFDGIPNHDRDDLIWNEAIKINLKNERYDNALELFREMEFSYAKASANTVVKLLQACAKEGAINEGKQIHGYVLKQKLESNLWICNSLISMYSRNGKLGLARRVFDSTEDHSLSTWNTTISSYAFLGHLNDAWNLFHQMELSNVEPDIITWNCLLSGHAIHGLNKEVLRILKRMQIAGIRPDSRSITSVLQAVIELGHLNLGKEIHGFVTRNGLDYDVYVGTSLIDMYVKNGCLVIAHAIFNNAKNKNIVTWNSLISGYALKGQFDDAKRLLNCMQEERIKPDLVTWIGLVSGYSIWGHSKEALAVIYEIKKSGLTPNVVSWTALISGCSQSGNYREALEFFILMQREGVKPNSATISSLLRTCGGLSLLQKGKEIHCLCTKIGFIDDVYITTALIDMYSKSGDLKSAHEVFCSTERKTLASWNCMIMGFAMYGHGREAISLFGRMQEADIQPDDITFTAVLSGCKNSGLVEKGWECFDSISKDYGIEPRVEHYSCMVDLLGRSGYLDEAWDFIQMMPLKPDATVWGALLGSCRIHKNVKFAKIAAKKLFELEPDNSANYVMMINLYAALNRWEDVENIKDLMSVKGLKNGHIWSWIQVDHTIHLFSAGGKPHQEEGKIYFELYQLVLEMKNFGYAPDTTCVYQNIDEVEKEKVLLSHTEKLAITYGLMRTKSSDPIRVFKNTRICPDCHSAAKFISLVRRREIFLRDGIRFHHFKAGKCTCNDCW